MTQTIESIQAKYKNNVPAKYESAFSSNAEQLLKRDLFTIDVEEPALPYALWSPFSFAGFPKYFPMSDADYGVAFDGTHVDYHFIQDADIGNSVESTISNVLSRLNIDKGHISYYPIYSYIKNDRLTITTDIENTPLMSGRFAGFAYVNREQLAQPISNAEWEKAVLAHLNHELIPVQEYANGGFVNLTLKHLGLVVAECAYAENAIDFFDYKIHQMVMDNKHLTYETLQKIKDSAK